MDDKNCVNVLVANQMLATPSVLKCHFLKQPWKYSAAQTAWSIFHWTEQNFHSQIHTSHEKRLSDTNTKICQWENRGKSKYTFISTRVTLNALEHCEKCLKSTDWFSSFLCAVGKERENFPMNFSTKPQFLCFSHQ